MTEKGRLKGKYRDFMPKFFPERLKKVPMSGFVFVADLGDLFGWWVPNRWIEAVFKAIIGSGSKATFLFLTKNPGRYHDFLKYYMPNMLFGATIETNRYYPEISKAPAPEYRYKAMKSLPKTLESSFR